ncbi:hypothetical protein NQZ68_029365 [Dissostichus eleginoides]|nr:hypothetical protein NQZ68_029365 [Dissostichus eleginoides]
MLQGTGHQTEKATLFRVWASGAPPVTAPMSQPALWNTALANAIQSNQPSQGLPIQPKSLHGYQKNSELGLLGARQGWGDD